MKIEGEMKKYLDTVGKGNNIEREVYKFYFGQEDSHYPGSLISGCKLLEKCVDFASAFIARRDEGISNLFVHMEGDILHPVGVCDVMEVVCWSIKDGNKSRVVGFEMYKRVEYDKVKDLNDVLDEPILCVKGQSIHVVGAWSHA